jgi:predicted permease
MRRLLPDEAVEFVCGDLDEEYRRKVATAPGHGGRLQAGFWYRSQAFRSAWQLRTDHGRATGDEGLAETGGARSAPRQAGDPDPRGRRDRDPRRPVRGRLAGDGRLGGGLATDFRHAGRQMRNNAGFALVAVATIALGIGLNTTVFSVVDGVLLRPLPYPDPQQLVMVREAGDDGRPMWPSYQNFVDWRDQSDAFASMAAMTFPGSVTVLGGVEPAQASGTLVTVGFFDMVDIPARMGRTLVAADHAADATPVLVVSHDFWRDVLGGVASLDGVSVDVAGRDHLVVGVMPPGFRVARDADMWAALENTGRESVRGAHWLQVVGRLRDAGAFAAAKAQLDQITARIHETYGDETEARAVQMTSLHDEVVGDTRRPLRLLVAAAGLVLLVACTNIASTLMARGAQRDDELSLRVALGATRGRVVRQLFVESSLLALSGTVVGVAAAAVAVRLLALRAAEALPRMSAVTVDSRVLTFTLLASVAATLLFGLLPALRIAGSHSRLAFAARGEAGDHRTALLWRALVGAQVALVVVLLLGSGLLLRSLSNILDADVGYDTRNVLSAQIHLPNSKYPDERTMAAFFARLEEATAALPGVESAGIGSWLPLYAGSYTSPVTLDGGERTEPGIGYRVASRGYFEALRIPLLRGRLFEAADTFAAPHVAVVNETFARRYWPDGDPLGERFRVDGMDAHAGEWLTVIGVVGEARPWSRPAGTTPEYYVSSRQRPFIAGRLTGVLVVRTAAAVEGVISELRRTIAAIDADVPASFTTLEAAVGRSVGDRRLTLRLLMVFAAAGLLLAGVGVYGVMSHSIAARRAEIGVRMAIGASPSSILKMVMGGAMRTVMTGVVLGLLGATALERLVRGMLYGVAPSDPLVILGAVGVLIAAASIASLVPARRATRMDPLDAMRN